jgi:uncharacterized protein YjbI with pentapeptide repeats/endonuclease YncB( thermonuclease family)
VILLWAILVATVLLAAYGLRLYWPFRTETTQKAALGAALLTGAVVSGALFLAQTQNDKVNHDQEKHEKQVAESQEKHEKRVAESQSREQERIARQQALRITVGLQHDLSGVDLEHQDLSGIDLGTKDLAGADLRHAILKESQLLGARLVGARLDAANLIGANLSEASLQNATLSGAHLEGAYFNLARLGGAIIGVGVRDNAAYLAKANFTDADLRGACLARADFHGANVHGADFSNAVLTHADLREATFEEDGVPVNLKHAWVAGVRIDKQNRHYLPTPTEMRKRIGPRRDARQPAHAISDRVVDIFDGDTIKLKRRGWVSLIGLNAPGKEDTSGKGNHPGNEALAFLEKTVAASPVVRYELGPQPREQFPKEVGRWRAYVWLRGGRFLNQALLEGGYARRELKPPEARRYAPVLEQAEQRAKAAGLRFWTTCRAQ